MDKDGSPLNSDSNPNSPNQPHNRAHRASKACDLCRRKKVKCTFKIDEESCLNCQAYKEKCEFTRTPRKRGPQKGYAVDLEERIEEMEQVIKEATSQSTANNSKRMRISDIVGPEIQKNRLLVQRRYRPKDIPTPNPRAFLSNIIEEYGVMDPRQWPSGAAYDHVYYLGDLSSLQLFRQKLNYDGETNKLQGHTIKRYGEDVVLVADPGLADNQASKIPEFKWPKNIHSTDEDIHKYIYTITGLDKYTSVRLLKIYFSHIHPILPVINKTEFIKQYRDKVSTYPSGELINAMFGAAARFVECESLETDRKRHLPSDAVWDVPVGWSNQFFDQAEYIISEWSTTPTISNVQAITLILNHRGDRHAKSPASWQLGGYAIRLAQLIGLHRNCDDWDIPKNEKETRKRVWWALYITDRFQSAIFGRPVHLRDEDISVPYPDPGADIEEVMDAYEEDKEKIQNNSIFPRFPSLTTAFDPSVVKRPHIYELFNQFIKLAEILGRILQGLHTPQAKKYSSKHGSDALVTRLDFELTEWRYAFPIALKNIQLPDFNEVNGHFAPAIASVLLFYFSTLISLHQPFIRKTMSRSSYTSQQICFSAAVRGTRIASRFTVRKFLMCPYSFTLYPIMQFGLIHMYNGKQANSQISEPARYYLKKGTELLGRLKDMSKTAQRMYTVFNSIIEYADLHAVTDDDDVERTLAEEENHLIENLRRLKERRDKEKTVDRPSMSSIMNSIMLQKPEVISIKYKFDFDDNNKTETEKEQRSRALSSDKNIATSASMNTECFINTDKQQQPFLEAHAHEQHVLQTQMQQTNNIQPLSGLNWDKEAFTLTQFGFNTSADTSALDFILQNIESMPSFTESMSDHQMFSQRQQQQVLPEVSLEPDQANIFVNEPNNVFWDLPASFDGDAITQWLNNMTQ